MPITSQDINQFQQARQQAFDNELANWHATGQFNYEAEEADIQQTEADWPEDSVVIDSPVSGSVWQSEVAVGDTVKAGQCLMILESMKMEIPVVAHCDGVVTHTLLTAGQRVNAGQALVVIEQE